MNGRVLAVALVLLIGVLAVPSGVAPCPNQPRDCNAFGDWLPLLPGDSKLLVGLYENDEPPQTDAMQSRQAQEGPTKNNRLEPGEFGGVVVMVEKYGNATGFTFTFPASIAGISWTQGNTLSIPDGADGDRFVLPFQVDGEPRLGFKLNFTGTDSGGNQFSGSLIPWPLLQEGVSIARRIIPAPGLLVLPGLLAALLVARKLRG